MLPGTTAKEGARAPPRSPRAAAGLSGPVCDGGSSVLAGQRSDGGAAGAAVPPHHLQHRAAGLQEDLGEGLSDGLDPQHVCSLLLTLLLRGRGGDLGGRALGKIFPVPRLRVYPSVYVCLVRIPHSISAIAVCSQVSWGGVFFCFFLFFP